MPKSIYAFVRAGKNVEKILVSDCYNLFLEYAILSANVYLDFNDPEIIPLAGWKNIDPGTLPILPPPKYRCQNLIQGLKYQVWFKELESKTKVVLVFKGTTFSFRNDWICNLRWLTMNPILKNFFSFFIWDYYHQVQVLTPLIIETIKKRN